MITINLFVQFFIGWPYFARERVNFSTWKCNFQLNHEYDSELLDHYSQPSNGLRMLINVTTWHWRAKLNSQSTNCLLFTKKKITKTNSLLACRLRLTLDRKTDEIYSFLRSHQRIIYYWPMTTSNWMPAMSQTHTQENSKPKLFVSVSLFILSQKPKCLKVFCPNSFVRYLLWTSGFGLCVSVYHPA